MPENEYKPLFLERFRKRGFFMETKRCGIVFRIFLFVMILLSLRIAYIQFFMGDRLARAASLQRMIQSVVERPRGGILDRNLIPFTDRTEKTCIVLMPDSLRNREDDVRKICNILNLSYEDIIKRIHRQREAILAETDQVRKNRVLSLGIKGVSAINSLKRYDQNTLAKHILGYLNRHDGVGEAGIEKFYEETLSLNSDSRVAVITDANKNPLEGLGYRIISAFGRNEELNVKLTLDYRIQKTVEEVMEKNGVRGAVVVEDVINGDIVAIASKPDFNPLRVGDYLNSPAKELFNRAVASYNLGSIFKIIVTAAALENGVELKEDFYCPGYIKVGDKTFACDNSSGHGLIGYREAFAWSCNPYFIELGIRVGHKKILEMASRFGLGMPTGVYRQGVEESSGNLPSPGEYFTYGDIANISIGQGAIMATPLQIADVAATVANGGIKNAVNIVDSVVDNDGNKIREIKVKQGHRVISRDIADTLKELMEAVTSEIGTGYSANLDMYGGAGGKTGSAETGQIEDGKRVTHAWFTGYFPRKDPRYSICVFVENGKRGGTTAAPVFAEIAEQIMKKKLF